MSQRLLAMCGMLAPLLFVFTAVLGGAMRPGYSHLSETVSELFSPGSPNKLLLDTLHTVFALLLVLFGLGVHRFVRRSKHSALAGKLGALLYIAMGLVSVTTATIFPQDAWGSPPTFAGEMHQNMSGVVGLLSILSILLLGFWFHRTGISPGLGIYSFVTAGAAVLAAVFFVAQFGSPIMGLAERIAALVGFLWTFTLALWIFLREGTTAGQ